MRWWRHEHHTRGVPIGTQGRLDQTRGETGRSKTPGGGERRREAIGSGWGCRLSRSRAAVAWYRFRSTFRSRRGAYLSLILLVGLVGGVAMAAIAGGRRTQSSYPVYFQSTNPSDFGAVTAVINPLIGSTVGYNPALVRRIAALPHVRRVGSAVGTRRDPAGTTRPGAGNVGVPSRAGERPGE